MKHFVRINMAAVLLLASSTAFAGNVGVDINVHVGDQPRPVVVREPVYQPPPQEVMVSGDIQFVLPGALGFYVAVGHQEDLFYVQNRYYLYRDGRWNRSSYSRGPWVVVSSRELPPDLRRHKLKQIRHYRDEEYVVYKRDRDHYRGKHFRSAREEWKEQKRNDKEDRKHEKRMEKEDRKQHRGEGRHD